MDAKAKKQLRKEIVKAIEKAALDGYADPDRIDDFVIGWLYQEAGIEAADLYDIRIAAIDAARKNPILI